MPGRNLEAAIAATREVGDMAMARWRGEGRPVDVWHKSHDNPVSDVDLAVDARLKAVLGAMVPEAGWLSEETADNADRLSCRAMWCVDPIDGTRDFIRGNAQWGVLLGLEEEGKPVAGIAHFPIMGKTFLASVGGGAWCNDRRIHVSSVDRLDRAVVCFNGMQNNKKWPYRDIVLDFVSKFWCMRSMSGSPDVTMVASGQADVWIEPSAKPWDLCPMKVIVEEAGGKFFNFEGTDSIYAGNALVCTPAFEQLLRDTFVNKF